MEYKKENKVEIYKFLIKRAIDFEYMQEEMNNLWEVITWDEELTEDEIDLLGTFITDNTILHFTF